MRYDDLIDALQKEKDRYEERCRKLINEAVRADGQVKGDLLANLKTRKKHKVVPWQHRPENKAKAEAWRKRMAQRRSKKS